MTVGYGRARETNEVGVYRVVIEYQDETGRTRVPDDGSPPVDGRHCRSAVRRRRRNRPALRSMAHKIGLGPSTRGIVDAAKARGIPRSAASIPAAWSKWVTARACIGVCAAETDRTSAIGQEIAQDKELTRAFLSSVGVARP